MPDLASLLAEESALGAVVEGGAAEEPSWDEAPLLVAILGGDTVVGGGAVLVEVSVLREEEAAYNGGWEAVSDSL